ncbi:acetyl-CoA carboxylase biotin carboxylase subunit family protein [Desulfococcus sp.]|uniref:ATP-grasp domain-containing protein n=1 Tax=Desulfococcus sp. TaxID=2025834 RepID=UPI0035949275
MEFLYLSPEFPPNYAQFILALDRLGVNVWAIGEADFYFMPERLRSSLRYYVQADLHAFPSVENAVATLMEAQAASGIAPHFDRVESHNENWLGLEARINEKLGMDGIRPADLERLRKKSAMKRVFQDLGLPAARGECIRDLDHGLMLAEELGYPLILKPDEGVGACGIHKVADEIELRELVSGIPPGTYVLEEFIDAPIVSYDGLTDTAGRIIFENSLVYGDGVLEYVLGKDTFFYVTRIIPEPLAAIGRRLVQAFNVHGKFFHFEFFRKGDAYLPIEINCRPPGGAILDMMNYSVDGDLYAAYARMIRLGEPTPPAEKKYYCAYVGRRERAYRLNHDEAIARCGDRLAEHGENPAVFQGAMSRYRYIVRSPSEEDLLRLARDLMEQ